MGRNAGWLTGAAALSKGEDCEGPDLIYLPELPFDLQLFGEKIKQLLQEKTSIVVAVSEGIRTEDGTYVCELGNSIDFVDAFGHKQLSGTASYLASYIAGEIGCKTRAIELSTLQRAASHAASRVDILEAYQVGGAAVKAADEGDTGKMVVLKRLSDEMCIRDSVCITTETGGELLIHIGIDTVKMDGKGFTKKVSDGDKVHAGDILVEADLEEIKNAGYQTTTMMILTNTDEFGNVTKAEPAEVKTTSKVMTLTK